MDYRELLIKYIAHVADEEGTTFIGHQLGYLNLRPVKFTEEEIQELMKLEEDSKKYL